MPKIVKTFKSLSSTQSGKEAFLNVVKSVGAALGLDYIKSADTKYYFQTDSIGYPGFCIVFILGMSGSSPTNMSIRMTTQTQSGEPYESDPNNIQVGNNDLINDKLLTNYNPATCVVFMDSNKDAVSFSVILSAFENGGDVSEKIVVGSCLKAFLAKDVNGGILCGIGDNHFNAIRTKTDSTFVDAATSSNSAYDIDLFPTCLHLTKMVNYLSPGYPEMKNAYISVVRPQDGYVNESYYAEGALWGFAGYYPAKLPSGVSNLHNFVSQLSPWVKY